jgi:hypothetical protein
MTGGGNENTKEEKERGTSQKRGLKCRDRCQHASQFGHMHVVIMRYIKDSHILDVSALSLFKEEEFF